MGFSIKLDGQIPQYANAAALPSVASNGDLAITLDSPTSLYEYDLATTTWNKFQAGGGGTGTVTSVSVVSANGFAGTVASATTTPAVTISTTVTGILQGNGTTVSAASTTGSGSVVLSVSPTLTGTLTAAAATLSGTLTMTNSNVLSAKQITYNGEVDDGNSGTSKTIDWTTGAAHKIIMTGNCAFSFTNPSGPCRVQLRIAQDATGGRTATWPTSAPKVFWPTVAPVLTPTASTGADIIAFWFDGTNYWGVTTPNFI